MKYCPNCAAPVLWRLEAGRERATCPHCGFIHYEDPKLVAVAVIPIDGKVVLGRRAMEPYIGFWSLPGGYVNRGEAVEAALVREVEEETRLRVEPEQLLSLYSWPDNPVVLAAYVARPVGGSLRVGEEVTEVGLFEPTALPDLAFKNDERILADWLSYEQAPKNGRPRGARAAR